MKPLCTICSNQNPSTGVSFREILWRSCNVWTLGKIIFGNPMRALSGSDARRGVTWPRPPWRTIVTAGTQQWGPAVSHTRLCRAQKARTLDYTGCLWLPAAALPLPLARLLRCRGWPALVQAAERVCDARGVGDGWRVGQPLPGPPLRLRRVVGGAAGQVSGWALSRSGVWERQGMHEASTSDDG